MIVVNTFLGIAWVCGIRGVINIIGGDDPKEQIVGILEILSSLLIVLVIKYFLL